MSATHPDNLLDAVAALRSGAISANELALQTLERARRAQQRTNCLLAIEAETLLLGAERADLVLADARRRGVVPVGALQGVPLAHKDMFGRGGGLVRYGSKAVLDQVSRQVATVTARLEQAGALEVGALNMAEFALGATGHNAAYDDCRNAWNPEHISGGSSSGSGAAVACGAAFASLGSDTGGSVRIPASANGLVGLKPTYGLIPRTGSMKLAPSIDVIGPMARTTADLAEILQLVAGGDGIDANASLRPISDYRSVIHQGVEKLRIGVPTNYFFDVATDEIREAMDRSLQALLRAGAQRVDVGGLADERQGVEIDPDFTADGDVSPILIGQGREVDFDAREIDVAAATQRAGLFDFTTESVGPLFQHAQLDETIINEDDATDRDR